MHLAHFGCFHLLFFRHEEMALTLSAEDGPRKNSLELVEVYFSTVVLSQTEKKYKVPRE